LKAGAFPPPGASPPGPLSKVRIRLEGVEAVGRESVRTRPTMVTPDVSVVGMHANSVRPMRNSRGEKGICSVRKPMSGVMSKMATSPYASDGTAATGGVIP
jgi:hypothetical protein